MSQPLEWPCDIPQPPHVYVPGKTARHPEDFFDKVKATILTHPVGYPLEETRAFVAGQVYFDAGYFWECHEVLEAVWMRTSDPSMQRDIVQALIQLANARLKILMDRPRAAERLCDMVSAHLGRCEGAVSILGLDVAALKDEVEKTRKQIFTHYNAEKMLNSMK